MDLSEKKAFLKKTITAIMLESEAAEEDEEEGEDEEEDGEEEEEEGEEEDEDEEDVDGEEDAEPKKRKTKRTDFQLSPALFEFMGGGQTMMARGDVRENEREVSSDPSLP